MFSAWQTGRPWLEGRGAVVVVAGRVGFVLYRPLLALCFDEAQGRPRSTCIRAWPRRALLVLLAIAIVSSFQAVGALFVFGLLVGATTTAFAARPPGCRAIMAVGALRASWR